MTPQTLRFARPVQRSGTEDQPKHSGAETRITGDGGSLNVVLVHAIVPVLVRFPAVSRPVSGTMGRLGPIGPARPIGEEERWCGRLKIVIRLAIRRELRPIGFAFCAGLQDRERQSLARCIRKLDA